MPGAPLHAGTKASSFSPTLWPRQLDAAKAAAFCGESVPTFRRKVARGIYPAATFQRRGCRPMWHRAALEAHLAYLHGLTATAPDEITELM